jgi:hypothetical protein
MPYPFQPRVPLDHVFSLIRLIRNNELGGGKSLVLVGAITGELGALLGDGPIFGLEDESLEIEDALVQLECLEFSAESAEPDFDISPFIPIILFVIKWMIERRLKG